MCSACSTSWSVTSFLADTLKDVENPALGGLSWASRAYWLTLEWDQAHLDSNIESTEAVLGRCLSSASQARPP